MNKHEQLPEVDAESVVELSDGLSIVLNDVRRKQLLSVLSSGDDLQTIHDLAADIDAESPGRRPGTESDDHLALVLHHSHLPKLADFGLIEYDSDQLEVRITAKGEQCVEIFGQIRNA